MLKIYDRLTGLILAVCLFLGSETVLAWDNKTTHKDLSEAGAVSSVLGSGYLNNIGFSDGLNASLHWDGGTNGKDKNIRNWIKDGADFEDVGGIINGRFYNHFHNPLRQQPWTDAGLNDSGFGWSAHGESALLWAQNAGVSDRSNTDWAWQMIRDHYYLSLTAPVKTVRDAESAQTFVGLGHQIHLIQDMSQPAHVRNDAHPEDFIGSLLPFHWLEAGRWKVWNI